MPHAANTTHNARQRYSSLDAVVNADGKLVVTNFHIHEKPFLNASSRSWLELVNAAAAADALHTYGDRVTPFTNLPIDLSTIKRWFACQQFIQTCAHRVDVVQMGGSFADEHKRGR
jgi:hypothetical protein